MTKKDYELIAACIFDLVNDIDNSYDDSHTKEVIWMELSRLAYKLAANFEADNPRFNRNKFLQACGIEPEFTRYEPSLKFK